VLAGGGLAPAAHVESFPLLDTCRASFRYGEAPDEGASGGRRATPRQKEGEAGLDLQPLQAAEDEV
jgi:hypothetical protein